MKTIVLAFLLLLGSRCTPTTVYICDSPNAVRYHLNQHCKGLSHCTHRILEVTEEKAKGMHLTLCKLEQ